jgi:hypothetical protein
MKQIFFKIGILDFLAIKNHYNSSVNSNDFYKMLKRRLKYKPAKQIAEELKHEFYFHYKEFSQYQN